jgi:YegS/Rv2252/BmrU family lipid kinase
MKNIAFIVNPIAGTKTKNRVSKLIRELLDKELFSPTIVTTEYAGHATQLAHHFALEGYYAVVAVGGDAVVNEVASGLRNSNTALGIVPNGDDNMFARHLDISTRMNRSIEMLNTSEVINVDYCTINDIPFFSACSIGFDSIIAPDCSNTNKGIKDYVESISENLVQHTPENYLLKTSDVSIETTAFFINFANANQWGNDANVAPKVSIQDGWIDITIVTKVPLSITPEPTYQLFTRNINENLCINTIRKKEITLVRTNEKNPIYVDGFPIKTDGDLTFKIVEDGLKVLVKKRF